jgi:phosphatidate cytidylyltransferase
VLFALLLLLVIVADVWKSVFTWKNVGYSLAGIGYISLSWALMIDLRMKGILGFGDQQWDLGWILPMVLIASIWINDTMAYIVGSLIGRTPLSSISPNKTWEGTIGGALLAIIVVTASWYFFVIESSWKQIAGIAAIAAIVGTVGDLFESKLKRLAHVKDSGHIMPGHGGFLDRFDSLLLATPVVWLFLYIVD